MKLSETKTIRGGRLPLSVRTGAAMVAAAAGLIAITATPSYAGPPSGYVLTWSDEFNGAVGSQPNSAYWNFDTGIGPNNDGWGNWEQQTYVSDTAHCQVISDSGASDGRALQIKATNDNNWQTYGFHSARINTIGKVTPQYGYIELRAKLPYGQGIWPAFWMLGTNFPTVGWPNCGEMDVMELFGQNPGTNMGSFHMGTPSNRIDWSASYTLPNGAWFNGGYHTFGLLWTSSGVTDYVDGVQYEYHASSSPGWAFSHPFYFIIDLAVGGIPPGNVSSSSTVFPQSLDIDYLRIYQPGSSGISNGVHTLTPQCATGARLDDSAAGTTNGNLVQIWQANGSQAQNWAFNNIGGSNYNMAVNLGPYCLDDMGGAQGTQVAVWSCNGGTNQKWTANSVSGGYQLVSGSGLCLDVNGASSANGSKVQSWTCNGSSAQTWSVN
jgi:beta-glucanase (GH16 family)